MVERGKSTPRTGTDLLATMAAWSAAILRLVHQLNNFTRPGKSLSSKVYEIFAYLQHSVYLSHISLLARGSKSSCKQVINNYTASHLHKLSR